MKRFFTLQFFAILLSGLGGCTEDLSDPMPDQTANAAVQRVVAMSPQEVVYDKATASWVTHRNDPYTLENFRQAYDNLLSGSARSRLTVHADELSAIELSATHFSVKIYPKTEAEQRQLEQTEDVKIVYLPFDYVQLPEAETSGLDRSAAAVIPDERRYTVTYDLESVEGFKKTETITLPVLYAVWPCAKPFPADMDYEIQYEVFLPEYASGSARSAMPASEALRMLEQEAITLALGELSTMSRFVVNPPTTKTISGSFKNYDNRLWKYVPLQNLLVRLQLGANIMETYTDANGVYKFTASTLAPTFLSSLSTLFYNPYWIITEPGSSSPITVTWGSINNIDLNITIKDPTGNKYNIHRAVNFYFNGEHDIPKMAYTYGCKIVSNPIRNDEASGRFYHENGRNNPAYLEIFKNEHSDSELIGVICHELGHYTQFCRRGGTDNFKKVAKFLKESYAEYVGWSLCMAYYTSLGWKNSDPAVDITRCAEQNWPCYEGQYLYYTPLFIDLVDDYDQPPYKGVETVDDLISNVPAAVIERIALEANDWGVCRNILCDYADKLFYCYPSSPSGGNPVMRIYYSTSQLNTMLPQYDRFFN